MSAVSVGSPQSARLSTGSLARAALIAAALAAIANIIVYFVARAAGVSLNIPLPPANQIAPLPLAQIIGVSAGAAIPAAILLAILARVSSRPFRIFQAIAIAFLLFSLVPVFTMPIGMGTRLALAAMHAVAAVVIVGVLSRLDRAR